MIIKAARNIVINGADSGAFIFGSKGATGKSFMGKILSALEEIGRPYAVVTYRGNSEVVYGNLETAKLVFFDRFDLYISKQWCKTIKNISKDRLVLVDLKQFDKFDGEFGVASIELSEDKIDIQLRG